MSDDADGFVGLLLGSGLFVFLDWIIDRAVRFGARLAIARGFGKVWFVESNDCVEFTVERLFEVVDKGGQHEFAEFTMPRVRVNSRAEPTFDDRKDGHGHLPLAV
jgi:hypothetical protein